MLQVAAYTPGKEKLPAYAEALEYQRENCPPRLHFWKAPIWSQNKICSQKYAGIIQQRQLFLCS